MLSNLTTRRSFAAKLAALFPGLGFAGLAAAAPALGCARTRRCAKTER